MTAAVPTAPSRGLSSAVFALALLSGCYLSHERDGALADGGVDATLRDAGRDLGRDAGARDAGATRCAPLDVREIICPSFICDDVGAWYWNGDRCSYIACGACAGTGCASGQTTEAACQREHALCEASVCRATGGDWLFWAEECGHYVCGRPVLATCEVGFPVCDCGISGTFDPVRGCEATCPPVDPLPPELRCTSTGGTWGAFCCDSICGVRCAEDCASLACDCGPGRVFDGARGCIATSRCFERNVGETCDPRARCETGAICCEHCGGPGCFGDPTCQRPVCDADPCTDQCGNRCDVP